jgi:hypothetical protein
MSGGVALGQGRSVALFDNFDKWTTDSDLLSSLATDFTCAFVPARLGFSPSGLRITGPTQDFQLTGVQSLSTFTAPFTVVTKVVATEGTANPFEIFLVSADLTQYLAVAGNVNPSVIGFWVVTPNLGPLGSSLGEQFTPNIVTALDTPYQIEIAVDAEGAATVNVAAGGSLLGTLSNLQPGTGPFYLILGQRLGYTATGLQVANWSYVGVTTPPGF